MTGDADEIGEVIDLFAAARLDAVRLDNLSEGGSGDSSSDNSLETLKTAGVQNTQRDQRLIFERIEPYAGQWIQAEGHYTEKDAPAIAEAGTRKYGKLPIMLARMNPDLAMGGTSAGETLLKKTGAGNLFMVFGEPDLGIDKTSDGKLQVTLRGVDIYDPTTGNVRSSSGTDDVACWFLDTNYNSESFFVRHAYFTGADAPYDKLKRALRAEIEEFARSTLYTNKSRPFEAPKKGKIAVKVINHYGDEVLKVYVT